MPRQNAVAYIHDYATLQHCMSACSNLVCGAVSFVFFGPIFGATIAFCII